MALDDDGKARAHGDERPLTGEPAWLLAARAETGVRSFPPGSSNPRITTYHAGTSIHGYDDKVSWCSSFVHWSLGQAQVQGTGSALARDWLQWGQPLEVPVPGCVAVLWREDPGSWKGHVGFFLRADSQYVVLLGGNQLGEVREHFYPLDHVLGYRWPLPSPTVLGGSGTRDETQRCIA